jgi:hypothetical protein
MSCIFSGFWGAGLGWAGLGWAGLGWAGLGWLWAGLGLVWVGFGLGWGLVGRLGLVGWGWGCMHKHYPLCLVGWGLGGFRVEGVGINHIPYVWWVGVWGVLGLRVHA